MKRIRPISLKSGKQLHPGASRSQGVVEFAIALPVLLLMLFGIIDFSLLFSAWLLIQNVSRQAVRYAVTTQFDEVRCADANPSDPTCVDQLTQDAARLLSIHDEGDRFRTGLLYIDSVGMHEPGFIQITVCSSRDVTGDRVPDFIADPGAMGSPTDYSECRPNEDPGGPNDTVVVMVDFNHPYITPMINQIWPMVHLYSAHSGTVESFRVSRLIELPPAPDQGTLTPSLTMTPSLSYTPSVTSSPSTTASPTNSPTHTNSPTPTPTPDCDLYSIETNWQQTTYTSGSSTPPRLIMHIHNSDTRDTGVSRMDFDWEAYDASSPGQVFRRLAYAYTIVASPGSSSSPTTMLFAPALSFPAQTLVTVYFDFKNTDAAWPGIVPASSFGLTMLLDNGCVVTKPAQATPTASLTPTISNTPTRSVSPTNTSSPTRTATSTKSYTPSLTGTRTNTPTITRTWTPSGTPTPTVTRKPSNTPSITWTSTRTWTATITLTPTRTFTPSKSPTRTNTPSITRTPTQSYTPSITRTPTRSYTPTISFTPTVSRTRTASPTITFTPTRSRTPTTSYTPTVTRTPTPSYTKTLSPTITYTPTRTFTPMPVSPTPSKTVSPTRTPTRSITPTPSETYCFDC